MGKITNLLKTRSSVRSFKNKPIPKSILDEILEAGRLAPSGGNEQPWRFGIITDPVLVSKIARLSYGQEWIAKAPLLIVLCTAFVKDEMGGRDIQIHRFPDLANAILDLENDLYQSLNQEEHQTKIAGTHMALAALEYGISSCWVSRFEVKPLARLLNLPESILPSEILVFGYPEGLQKATRKKCLKDITFYNLWEYDLK
jgi:nitroreductase